ncbi:uncharacterized protein MELLADRAFT_63956 [Melampsora larici-populina 98AG31]|uniref:UBC core domain-containing protein n=1 Tax=Melampsora larici-populina (strain 98AG31 / pathotype 3-4-7) TaxID=747676 RepID=F4RPM2_MELLP|nr:uncharacterized protein MELLADRAFT_63956 [Melampsora larici-populina 98AG31]EGG05560.1 hypothetical protein MELLADRAFT_63956 [Melampsora larici-populina 98AG31]
MASSSNSNSISQTEPKNNQNSTPISLNSNVTKRLSSELMTLMMSASTGISAFPVGGDLTKWTGTIVGPSDTVYDSLKFKISLSFPSNYPFVPPIVKFESPCYHPNVDLHGNICLDILKEKWSAVLSVQTILISIQSLFGEPNNESPLNVEAAELWDNQNEFKKRLLLSYKPISE